MAKIKTTLNEFIDGNSEEIDLLNHMNHDSMGLSAESNCKKIYVLYPYLDTSVTQSQVKKLASF